MTEQLTRALTLADGERLVLMDMLARAVALMNCCDEAYAASHDEEPTTDEEWDEFIEEAEELLDELEERERAGIKP
jgi:predicted neutral ceramidase superfamily lipid hydrolase